MVEILPIKLLTEEDSGIFGSLNINLSKLLRSGLPVGKGIAVSPPEFKLKSVLEHYDFGTKEVFEQSLTLVQKEINSIPAPEILIRETEKQKRFFLNGQEFKSVKDLWVTLLSFWLAQIKQRILNNGFYKGVSEGLEPQIVIFVDKLKGFGEAYFDSMQDDVLISVKLGKLHPNDLKKIVEIVKTANKKLLLPYKYEWILDNEIKLVKILPHTPTMYDQVADIVAAEETPNAPEKKKLSAVKVFFDLSGGFTIEKDIDGVYIASEKIFDLNKPRDSFENLVFKLVESAVTFPESPVFFKLADKSEGMGKVRGALRLLHQQNLFNPLAEAVSFARHKKGLNNVHIVIPFVRGVSELLKMKRELATKKLIRKNSLQIWMEAAVPENIVNMEEYLLAGIDGIVLNLDELIAHLNGFDPSQDDLMFYKNEADGLIKFLEDSIKLLHKSKVPFVCYGSVSLYPKVLEYLVEKGVYGVVVEKYEAHSARDLLYQTEKRVILRKS